MHSTTNETPGHAHSLLMRADARPCADFSAWVLSASGEAGLAANEKKKPADLPAGGQSASPHAQMKADALVIVFWLACCLGLWVVAL